MADDFGDGPLPPMGNMGSGSGLKYHLEGLVPLVLVLIIAAVAGSYLGFWYIPFISSDKPVSALVIGSPSNQFRAALDVEKDIVTYVERDVMSLRVSPKDYFAQFDVIIFNQSELPISERVVPRTVADALVQYVEKGGKLIVVGPSGIFSPGSIEVIGWEASFGDLVPAKCIRLDRFGTPSCTVPFYIPAQIVREVYDHDIMEGIEVVPAIGSAGIFLETFDVQPNGTEIAYIQNVQPGATDYYPAIVEKRRLVGKSIYFNYDPGLTPRILINTIKYLRRI